MRTEPEAIAKLERQVWAQLDNLMANAQGPGLAVAVSGGSDSMALCLMAAAWARRNATLLQTLTVDHGLRDGSAAEAAQVADWLGQHGIPHHTLTWRGAKPSTGIQARARAARYDLLFTWCRENGFYNLATAHHREDQIETVLLRLQKASGFAGLAGMAERRNLQEMQLLRPFLTFARADLRHYLERRGQAWLADPSNENLAFARIRLRQRLQSTLVAKPDIAAVLYLSENAARLRRAWWRLSELAARPLATIHPAGFIRLTAAAWRQLPSGLAREVLRRGLMSAGGAEYGPDRAALERLAMAVRRGTVGLSRNLNHCRVLLRGGDILLFRENRNLPPPLIALRPGRHVWGNYCLTLAPESDGEAVANRGNLGNLSFGALGQSGWRQIRPDLAKTAIDGLPKPIFPVLPCLRDKENVVFVPYLGFMAEAIRGYWRKPPSIEYRPRHEIF